MSCVVVEPRLGDVSDIVMLIFNVSVDAVGVSSRQYGHVRASVQTEELTNRVWKAPSLDSI